VKLVLHIGTEKTGTTSVQNFFRWNRERLAERGILYPEAPGHRNHTGLATAAQSVDKRDPLRKTAGLKTEAQILAFREELFAGLAREAAARPFRLAVMSGEHCSSRLLEDEEVVWLKEQLDKLFTETRIVVYLRRQDDYLLSTYSTAVKSGNLNPIATPKERTIDKRYNHWDMLARWARVFGRGNIVCRKFERSALRNGDIVDDFLDVVGIDGRGLERPEPVNESLDAEALEFLRLFNKHVPRFVKGGLNPLRGNIAEALGQLPQGPLLTLPDAELAEFMGLFADSNRRVAEEYFGGPRGDTDDPLFERRSDTRARVQTSPLSAERAVELSALLWQEKQAQVNRLLLKVKKHRGAAQRRKNEETD